MDVGATTDVPIASPARDPRGAACLPARDYEALRYISAWYQVAQYQLEGALFADRSPTVVSRCVRRLAAAGYVVVERWNRVGVNLLRTTARGRIALLARGVDDGAIFVPEKAVALKDLAHHLWIVDAGLALKRVSAGLDVAPCWSLRRKLAALKPAAIPDLLVLRHSASGKTDVAIAVEVDLGGERLKNVFLPKLAILRNTLAVWAGNQTAAIVVMTVGQRRIAALTAALRTLPDHVAVFVSPLPHAPGRAALAELRAMFAPICAPPCAAVEESDNGPPYC